MTKAEAFKKWHSQRTSHPAQVDLALDAILELEEKLSSCKLLAEYVLKQTEGAELKSQSELFSLVTDIEYEVQQLLVEEF